MRMMFDIERRKLEEEAGGDRFLCMMARQTIELMEEQGSAGLVLEDGKTLAGLKKIFDKFAGENRKGNQAVIMPDEAAEMICDYYEIRNQERKASGHLDIMDLL